MVHGAAYSGHYRQVVLLFNWSVRQVSLYVVASTSQHSLVYLYFRDMISLACDEELGLAGQTRECRNCILYKHPPIVIQPVVSVPLCISHIPMDCHDTTVHAFRDDFFVFLQFGEFVLILLLCLSALLFFPL